MFSVETDQVCRDAIKIGDTLTYKQVYNFAKMESTIAQREVLSIKPQGQNPYQENQMQSWANSNDQILKPQPHPKQESGQ